MSAHPAPDHQVEGTSADVHIVDLVKQFGTEMLAVDHVTLDIPSGSFFALLGPSGCGKTTTLRMLGGLEIPTGGRIYLGDEEITDRKPYRRPVNTVFQNYALFPHLNLNENVAFGLRRKGRKGPEVMREVDRMLELVELGGLGNRKPSALSGGQQQRVALARALINNPQVLLLDEPLGALDLKLRKQMQLELKRIQTEVGITFVHVTHDQEEAMTMADTIAVMRAGRVEQLGSPEELYERPRTEFVANFLGQSNLLDGTVQSRDGDHAVVDVHNTAVRVPAGGLPASGKVRIGVRPEKLDLAQVDGDGRVRASASEPAGGDRVRASASDPAGGDRVRAIASEPAGGDRMADGRNALVGTVIDSSFIGVSIQYVVRTAWGAELMVFVQNRASAHAIAPGNTVTMRWEPEQTFVLEMAA